MKKYFGDDRAESGPIASTKPCSNRLETGSRTRLFVVFRKAGIGRLPLSTIRHPSKGNESPADATVSTPLVGTMDAMTHAPSLQLESGTRLHVPPIFLGNHWITLVIRQIIFALFRIILPLANLSELSDNIRRSWLKLGTGCEGGAKPRVCRLQDGHKRKPSNCYR